MSDYKFSVQARQRIVHGWAFEDLTLKQHTEVEKFLETGRLSDVPKRWRQVARAFIPNDQLPVEEQ